MMAQFSSEAERLRHHRRCFEHALERGITPKAAEQELKLIAAREKDRAAMERLTRKKAIPMTAPFESWEAPWMVRD